METDMATENLLDHSALARLTKEEVIKYHLKVANLSSVILDLKATVKEFSNRLEKTEGKLEITINANKLLKERVDQLERRVESDERRTINNAQYIRNRQVEVKGVKDAKLPEKEGDLKIKMAELFALTGKNVVADDLDKCHMLGKGGNTVIMEFKTREKRDAMLRARSQLKNKRQELADINMSNAFIIESMTREDSLIDYICRQLKKTNMLCETWFFNGRLWLKVGEHDKKMQISHIQDLWDIFGRDNIQEMYKQQYSVYSR